MSFIFGQRIRKIRFFFCISAANQELNDKENFEYIIHHHKQPSPLGIVKNWHVFCLDKVVEEWLDEEIIGFEPKEG